MLEEQRKCQCGTPMGKHPHSKNSQMDEWIDRIAAAIAEADSADYWVPEITDWETSEEWKREAYPDEYPSSAYEDRERYRKQARAALLALEPETDQELQDRIEVLEKNLAYEAAQ